MKSIATTSNSKGIIKRKTGFGMGFFKTHSPLLTKHKKALISRQLRQNNSNLNNGTIINKDIFNSNHIISSISSHDNNPVIEKIKKVKNTSIFAVNPPIKISSPFKVLSSNKSSSSIKISSPVKVLSSSSIAITSPLKLSTNNNDRDQLICEPNKFLLPICKSGIKKNNNNFNWNQHEALKSLISSNGSEIISNISQDESSKPVNEIKLKMKDICNLNTEPLCTKLKLKSKSKSKSKQKSKINHSKHHISNSRISNSRRLFRLQQQQATPLSSDDSSRRESMPSLSKTNLESPFNNLPSPFQITPSPSNLSRYCLPSSLYNCHFGTDNNTLTPSETDTSPFTKFKINETNNNVVFQEKDIDTPFLNNNQKGYCHHHHHQNIFTIQRDYNNFDFQSPTPKANFQSPTSKINFQSKTPKVSDNFSSPTPSPSPAPTSNKITRFMTSYQSTEDLLESPCPSIFSCKAQFQEHLSSPSPCSSPLGFFSSNINNTTPTPSSNTFIDFKINKRSDMTLDFMKEQFENNSFLSPTPPVNNILRKSKSMIEDCNDFIKSEIPKANIKDKEDFIILSPTPMAPRRHKALLSTSFVDSVASTSNIKKEEDDKENNLEEGNHDTKINNDYNDSNLDYSSPLSSSESSSFSKLFPQRICRTYSECSLKYLKNWKDASSFGHGEDSILPYDSGKDSLKRITADTLSKLLQGKYKGKYDEFHIIDCRFPYEYEGGHICHAKNINDPKQLYNLFFKKEDYSKKVILIFHCEFSSERGPWMAQFFRKADREKNRFFYPRLHYPEVYVLSGGYKEFYNCHKELCSPQRYVEMADSKYIEQCKHHRKMFKKAKSTSELYYSSKYQINDEDSSIDN
ncbi:hypothetical protein U3516DRAFT_788056 [Neocallimastix sp. 'constans']|jgi:rhodanese-related sulfurtransferase